MTIPTVTTARLILRPFTEEDAGPLHLILGEKDILRYFPNSGPPAIDRVQRLVDHQIKHWEDHSLGWWAVERHQDPGLIGWAGLQFLPETAETEVAYLLSRSHWGHGLATEAARASVQFGFEHRALATIIALVHPENRASQRVIEKLGMSFVDESRYFGLDLFRYALQASAFGHGRWIRSLQYVGADPPAAGQR